MLRFSYQIIQIIIHNGSLKNVQSDSHGWKKVIITGLLCKIKQHAVSI